MGNIVTTGPNEMKMISGNFMDRMSPLWHSIISAKMIIIQKYSIILQCLVKVSLKSNNKKSPKK